MKFQRQFLLVLLAALLLVPAAFAAEVQISGASTVDGPAPVVHNGCLWVFYNTGGSLGYKVTTGNSSWTGGTVSVGNDVSLSPSAVSYDGQIYIFYRQSGTGLIKYHQMDTGTNCYPTGGTTFTIPTDTTAQAPEAALFNDEIFLFWQDTPNGTGLKFRHVTGSSWDSPQAVPFGNTSMGPGASAYNGRLYINYRGKDTDALFYGSQDTAGTWSSEQNLGVGTSLGPQTWREPSATEHGSRLYFVYKGKDTNNIYYKNMDNLGTWSTQAALSVSRTSHSPAAVSFNGQLWFFYKGESTNNLYHNNLN